MFAQGPRITEGEIMEEKEHSKWEEEDLLRRFRNACPQDGPGEGSIDPNLLASYIDGRATHEEAEAVEAAMLADPELLDAVRELRRILEPGASEVPEGLSDRVRSALFGEGEAPVAVVPSRFFLLKLAAAAAAVVFTAFLGFRLGQARTGESPNEEAAILSEMTVDLRWDRYDPFSLVDRDDE